MGGMSLIKIGNKPDFAMVLKQDQKEELEMYNKEAKERLNKALKMLLAQWIKSLKVVPEVLLAKRLA